MMNVTLQPKQHTYKPLKETNENNKVANFMTKQAPQTSNIAFKGYYNEYKPSFKEKVGETFENVMSDPLGFTAVIMGSFVVLLGSIIGGVELAGKADQFIRDLPEAKVTEQVEQNLRQSNMPHSLDVIVPPVINNSQALAQFSINGNPQESFIYEGETYAGLPTKEVTNPTTAMDDICKQIRPGSSAYVDLGRADQLKANNPGAYVTSYTCLIPAQDITNINLNPDGNTYKVMTDKGLIFNSIQPDTRRNDEKDEASQLNNLTQTLGYWVNPEKQGNSATQQPAAPQQNTVPQQQSSN